jgi:hypothetical protein
MLSTIVVCDDKPAIPASRESAGVLSRTLASLVAAKVEGLLGDVQIAGPSGEGLNVLANHAGCDLVEGDCEADWLAAALQAARGPDVFLLRCGRAPEAGFIEETRDFLTSGSKDRQTTACLRCVPETFLERLFPRLAPVAGLIASRDVMLRAPRGGFAALVRGIGTAETLHTRARRIR